MKVGPLMIMEGLVQYPNTTRLLFSEGAMFTLQTNIDVVGNIPDLKDLKGAACKALDKDTLIFHCSGSWKLEDAKPASSLRWGSDHSEGFWRVAYYPYFFIFQTFCHYPLFCNRSNKYGNSKANHWKTCWTLLLWWFISLNSLVHYAFGILVDLILYFWVQLKFLNSFQALFHLAPRIIWL